MSNKYEIRELIDKLNYYTKKYDEGSPEISDKEWDDLYFELEKLEKSSGILYPDSPTQKIDFQTVSELKKVKHNHPMLSLDKTKSVEELQSFVNEPSYKEANGWCAMFKMDGLTCSLHYINGKLVSAETRGNGVEGEDITHNAFVVNNIPKIIPTNEEIIVDGEIICDYINFSQFEKDFANPRNFAAGSIRQLSSKEAASRQLSFIAWDLIKGCEDIDFFFWRLEKLDEWGFTTVPRIGDAETVSDAIEFFDNERKEDFEWSKYPIDGYVFRFQSQKYYNNLGSTEHHFRGAIAYKFYDEEYETELIDIEWSMGRTGVLTPVATFKPINIDGSVVARASLHNLSILRETLGRYPEKKQKIWVAKMNMIIPQIVRAEKNNNFHDHILENGFCTHCPICGKPTEAVESDAGVYNIVCMNPSCEGKLAQRIDHFCGKKGLDIKGISRATIEKLIDWGWLNGLGDIFDLDRHRTEWISKAGFGEASVGKILSAITSSRSSTSLESFISAIGIPLIGRTISKEIIKYYNTWEDFRNAVGGDWTQFEGFGPEISKAINKFDYTEADKIANLLNFSYIKENNSNNKVKDLIFVITGRLSKKRDDIKKDIENSGGKVTNSVSSKTNYLVCNDKNSTTGKSADARRLNIPIITEEELIEMIK